MRSPLGRERRRPPGFIRPCQPVLSLKVPIGDGWIHELKHDGFRIVALKDGDQVRCGVGTAGTGAPTSSRSPPPSCPCPVTRIILAARPHCGCRTSTRSYAAPAALQRASTPSISCRLGDEDLRRLTLVERRALLREHLRRAGPAIVYSDHMSGTGRRGDVPSRLRHGPRRDRLEARDSRYKSGRCLHG